MSTLAIVSASLTTTVYGLPIGNVNVTIAGEKEVLEGQSYIEKFNDFNLPIFAPTNVGVNHHYQLDGGVKLVMGEMGKVLGFFAARGYVVVGNTFNTMLQPGVGPSGGTREVVVTYTLQK